MSQSLRIPSTAVLLERFTGDFIGGELVWKPIISHDRHGETWNTRYAGKLAGAITKKGYTRVHLDYVCYYAHNLIWKLVTGHDPMNQIDHINKSFPLDNSFGNLREATPSQNSMHRGCQETNVTKLKGVMMQTKGNYVGYTARITVDGKRMNLGTYKTQEEAYAVYCRAATELHKEFACFD